MNNNYGNRRNTEQELLLEALEAFQRETRFKLKTSTRQALMTGERGPGAKLRMTNGDTLLEFCVEIKATINEALLGRIKHQFEEQPGKWLVITRYVPGPLAKKKGIRPSMATVAVIITGRKRRMAPLVTASSRLAPSWRRPRI